MKKTAAKKNAPAAVKKTAAKESPILTDVKQLYGFMQDNSLDTIEYNQNGLYLRLVKAKPAMVPVPVNAGGFSAAQGGNPAVPVCKRRRQGGKRRSDLPD